MIEAELFDGSVVEVLRMGGGEELINCFDVMPDGKLVLRPDRA